MSLSRAWTRRPVASEPWFGRLLHPAWTESTVTLLAADARIDDNHGGTEMQGGPAPYLTSRAHVEVLSVQDASPDALGPVNRSMLRMFLPWPPEGARMPQRGDTAVWTDDTGRTLRLAIRTVESPETLHSHLELSTEAFD